MKVLLHTCCGPCASGCIPRLNDLGHEITMFFSNSNIDTREEFERRRKAALQLAAFAGVELVTDEYTHEDWLEKVASGHENDPERGNRCALCFKYSLARAAAFASGNGFDAFTTSLTVSPHKDSKQVFSASDEQTFLKEDFKKRDGFKTSLLQSKALGLYRQAYCGCEFSKKSQVMNSR